MKRKEEEKNKVGRPKLADDNLKKKSYIMLGVALLLVACLTFGGILSVTSIKPFNLKGETNNYKLKYKYKVVSVDPQPCICEFDYSPRCNTVTLELTSNEETTYKVEGFWSYKSGKLSPNTPKQIKIKIYFLSSIDFYNSSEDKYKYNKAAESIIVKIPYIYARIGFRGYDVPTSRGSNSISRFYDSGVNYIDFKNAIVIKTPCDPQTVENLIDDSKHIRCGYRWDGIEIFRSTNKVNNYKKIAKISNSNASFEGSNEMYFSYRDKNLKPNTTYYYKFREYSDNNKETYKTPYSKFSDVKSITTKQAKVKFSWNKLKRYTYKKDMNNMYFRFDKTSPGVKIQWGFEGPGSSIIKGLGEKSIGQYTQNGDKNYIEVAFDKPGKYTISAWEKGNKSNKASTVVTVITRVKFKWDALEKSTNQYFKFENNSGKGAISKIQWGFSGPGSTIINGTKQKINNNAGNTNVLRVAFDKPGIYTIYAWEKGNSEYKVSKQITVK